MRVRLVGAAISAVLLLQACGSQEPAPETRSPQAQYDEAERCFYAAAAFAMFEAYGGRDPNQSLIASAMERRALMIAKGAEIGLTEEQIIARLDTNAYTLRFLAPNSGTELSEFGRGEVEHCGLIAVATTP